MKNMSDKGFLTLLKTFRFFTIIATVASAILSFLILNTLNQQPTQIASLTSKAIFIIVGLFSIVTIINCFTNLLKGNRNEDKVNPKGFLFDVALQIISLFLVYFATLSFDHLLTQPATSNLALQNSHDITLITIDLIIALFIAGILSITNSIFKNYSIKHFETKKEAKLNIINNKVTNDERKAPRKKVN